MWQQRKIDDFYGMSLSEEIDEPIILPESSFTSCCTSPNWNEAIGLVSPFTPMKLLQCSLTPGVGWKDLKGELEPSEAKLVLAFGLRAQLNHPTLFDDLRSQFPSARIVIVSTSGNFSNTFIDDEAVVCTALRPDHFTMTFSGEKAEVDDELSEICRRMVTSLAAPELRHVLIFSDGSTVNGTTLSETFNAMIPLGVTISGGLAGDGTDFLQTLVGLDATPSPGMIVGIGLCGELLEIAFGSSGGWSPFGPKRTVTASHGNVLHELDGKPALELYKNYLGPEAESLPAGALRFPLHVTAPGQTNPVVRTILSLDEKEGSMTFAGDIPVHSSVQFMRASYEDLIAGAEDAATDAALDAELILCVSCVGRRIVLGQRVEEELEGVRAVFGSKPVIAGFYSYGELAPSGQEQECQLHNQTMTITSISERVG